MLVSFNFAPKGWAACDGQLLPINQNQALFSLLGTTYGGDGRVNFALPDLRGRMPVHFGSGLQLGQRGGEESHALTEGEIPTHRHDAVSMDAADTASPVGKTLGRVPSSANVYAPANNLTPLHSSSVGSAGGGQGHENRQPYLTLNFVIALQGIFPSQT
jgi:microcystin-dependent protein